MRSVSKYTIAAIILSTLMFYSCEKVIDVDLNEANPQLVIDANLHNGVQDFVVKISKTTSYYNTEPAVTIDNAKVELQEDNGNPVELTPISKGKYVLQGLEAKINSTYTLSVLVDGQEYLATAKLPSPVDIDEITWVKHFNGPHQQDNDIKYTLFCEYSDPQDQKNYYSIVVPVANQNKKYFWLSNDESSNGTTKKIMLRQQLFDAGDTLHVELHSIDQGVHQFYRTLSDIMGNSITNSAAPSNPTSNFSNGALGCFNVSGISEKIVVLPQ